MKRIASLFLLVSLFYNVLGYYLMFSYQEEQAWVSAMEKTPDSGISSNRIECHLIFLYEDTDFEYVNENVIIENKSYHIFKKRIHNNILSLYYLRNSYGDVIGKDLKDIVDNQLFDSTPSENAPIKKLLKTFLQDYIPNTTVCVNFSPNSDRDSKKLSSSLNLELNSGYLSSLYMPPKFV